MVGAEAGLGLAPGGLVQGQGSGVVSGGRKEVGEVVAVASGVAVGGPSKADAQFVQVLQFGDGRVRVTGRALPDGGALAGLEQAGVVGRVQAVLVRVERGLGAGRAGGVARLGLPPGEVPPGVKADLVVRCEAGVDDFVQAAEVAQRRARLAGVAEAVAHAVEDGVGHGGE